MTPWGRPLYGAYVTLEDGEKYMMYFSSACDAVCWLWGHGYKDYELYYPKYILN